MKTPSISKTKFYRVIWFIWSFHWVKKRGKNWKGRLWVHETLIWELICRNKRHPGISGTSSTPEIVVATHFPVKQGNKTIQVFLPTDGETSWLLPPSLVSYSCIFKVTGQVWESQTMISININLSYHQLLSS